MDDFTKGAVCAIAVVVFGKIMYEKGRRSMAKQIGEFIVTIAEKEKEES